MPDNHPVPNQTQRHSPELRARIIEAATNGLSGAAIQRALQAGTLDGWDGHYLIPKETVNLYIRDHRKAAARDRAGQALEQGLNAAIYDSATELYRMARSRLDTLKESGTDASLDTIENLAKVLTALAKLAPLKPTGTSTERPNVDAVPSDPIAAAIAAQHAVPSPLSSVRDATQGHKDAQAIEADAPRINTSHDQNETVPI